MKLLRLIVPTLLALVNFELPALAHIKKGSFKIEGAAEGDVVFMFDTDKDNEGTITFDTDFGEFPFDITKVEFDEEDKWKITKMDFKDEDRKGTIDFTQDPPEGDIDGNEFTITKDENGNSTLKVEKVKPKEKKRDNSKQQLGTLEASCTIRILGVEIKIQIDCPSKDNNDENNLVSPNNQFPGLLVLLNDEVPSSNDPLISGLIEIDDISVLAPADDNSGWFLDKTNYKISVGGIEVLNAELVNIFLFNNSEDPMFDSEIQAEFRNITINNVINSPYLDLLVDGVITNQPRHLSIFSDILAVTNNLTVPGTSDAKVWDDGTKVPEPTSTLSLLALGALGTASTLKSQLKRSKSKKHQTKE